MSSLFRSINQLSEKREAAVKEVLVNTLMENVREIEFEVKQTNCDCLETCESTSSLCITLEAIFLHGLKDSFLWETLNVIVGDGERKPEPSFWTPLLIFMHKQIIEQIYGLCNITTEIGQCRAWIRLSLNDSVFSSYLTNMKKNSSALNPYYKRHALLRDNDALEKTTKLIEELEQLVSLKLPYNSSLLNYWSDNSLQLSGLWTPAMKTCPISSGIDIAEALSVETPSIPTPQPLKTNELFSESISNSPFRATNFNIPDLTHRENANLFFQEVDMILEADDCTTEASEKNQEKTEEIEGNKHVQKDIAKNLATAEGFCCKPSTSHGNALNQLMQSSWSSDLNAQIQTPSEEQEREGSFQRSNSTNSNSSLRSPLSDLCSYNDLLRKHQKNQSSDCKEIWAKFLSTNSIEPMVNSNVTEEASDEVNTNDIEFVTSELDYKFHLTDLEEMAEQLCKLARESGLDGQGFMCKSCLGPLGIGLCNYKVCGFSGNYFCDGCIDLELVVVPARIIFNWDFRKYHISKRAADFLAEFKHQPFIDLKLLSPNIYKVSDAMAELQSLRIRLNFIRAYLLTCSKESYEILQKKFYGKEYLYETIHLYSIEDLSKIERGILSNQLQKIYKKGESHILNCFICSVKGFICEICKSNRILYPFHIDTTFRCEFCGAVFHDQCLNDKQPCPKCERKKKRDDMILLELDESGNEE